MFPLATASDFGLVAVGGAIGIISSLITLIFTHLKEKRQEDRRWERDLREVCAKFYAAAMALATPVFDKDSNPTEPLQTLLISLGEVLMLAPKPLSDVAQKFFGIAAGTRLQLEDSVKGKGQRPDTRELARIQEDFVACVRNTLGVVHD
jgi:hypothetical protein